MKKVLRTAIALLLAMVLVLAFTGCGAEPSKAADEDVTGTDFETLGGGSSLVGGRRVRVLVDKETGVQYILLTGSYGATSITPRLNTDGTLYKGDN